MTNQSKWPLTVILSSITIFFIIALSMACGGGGSGGNSDEDTLNDLPLAKAESYAFSGAIFDSGTINLVEDVIVEITGDHADKIVDGDGNPTTVIVAEDGLISFYINNYIPTDDAPAKFTLIATKTGYISTSKEFLVYEEGNYEFELQMINISSDSLPTDIAVTTTAGTANASGVIQQTIALEASVDTLVSGNTIKGSASVTIPQGVVAKDADGNILSGNLELMASYFNNMSGNSLDSFPGGLDATVSNGGESQEGFFVSGGFSAIELTDENGLKAKNFSSPITIRISLSANTINPDTGETVKAGDTIDLWSYDETTAKWSTETSGLVQGPAADGQFYVEQQIEHLSYWNLDWFSTKRVRRASINVIDQFGKTVDQVLYLKLQRKGGGFARRRYINPRGRSLKLLNVPGDASFRLKAYIGRTKVGQLDTFCNFEKSAFEPDTLKVTLPTIQRKKINFHVGYVRADNNKIRTSVASTYLFLSNRALFDWKFVYTNPGGIAMAKLYVGQTYRYWVYNRALNKWESGQVEIEEKTNNIFIDMVLPRVRREFTLTHFDLAHSTFGSKTNDNYHISTLNPVFKFELGEETPYNLKKFFELTITKDSTGESIKLSDSRALKSIKDRNNTTFYLHVGKPRYNSSWKSLEPGETYTYNFKLKPRFTISNDGKSLEEITGKITTRNITFTYPAGFYPFICQVDLGPWILGGFRRWSPFMMVDSKYPIEQYDASQSASGYGLLNYIKIQSNGVEVLKHDANSILISNGASNQSFKFRLSDQVELNSGDTVLMDLEAQNGLSFSVNGVSTPVMASDLPPQQTIYIDWYGRMISSSK